MWKTIFSIWPRQDTDQLSFDIVLFLYFVYLSGKIFLKTVILWKNHDSYLVFHMICPQLMNDVRWSWMRLIQQSGLSWKLQLMNTSITILSPSRMSVRDCFYLSNKMRSGQRIWNLSIFPEERCLTQVACLIFSLILYSFYIYDNLPAERFFFPSPLEF